MMANKTVNLSSLEGEFEKTDIMNHVMEDKPIPGVKVTPSPNVLGEQKDEDKLRKGITAALRELGLSDFRQFSLSLSQDEITQYFRELIVEKATLHSNVLTPSIARIAEASTDIEAYTKDLKELVPKIESIIDRGSSHIKVTKTVEKPVMQESSLPRDMVKGLKAASKIKRDKTGEPMTIEAYIMNVSDLKLAQFVADTADVKNYNELREVKLRYFSKSK